MNFNCRWGFRFGLAMVAVGLFAPAGPAAAYTPEQEQACTPDAMRLCSSFVPDVDAITACMIEKKSQLSPECRRFFRPDSEVGARRAVKTKKPASP